MTLRSTISTPEGKRRYVRRLFATIADRYDVITVVLSYGQDRRWKRRLIDLAAVGPADRVLDLACGTGDLLLAAASRARFAIGLDITHRMLQLAARRVGGRIRGASPARADLTRSAPREELPHGAIALITGDMLALPFGASQFDLVTTGYGLRNVPNLERAIREIYRVLAPGGRILSLDFNRPDPPIVRAVYLAYLTVVGSLLGLVLHRDPDTYRYIPESIRLYPGAAGVARLFERAGFVDVRVVRVLGGLMAIHVAHKSTKTSSISPATARAPRVGTRARPPRTARRARRPT
ncbi:MAG: class I SAM-dependent methyltransferase [Acidobacteria bacterium]|nr:class I SAM-dependent methyltransferase [Acidobacteriota bacterium]